MLPGKGALVSGSLIGRERCEKSLRAHGGCKHGSSTRGGRSPLVHALPGAEEERFVSAYRTAQLCAELVALEYGSGCGEEWAGVEDVVANERVAAVKVIRAGLGHRVYRRPRLRPNSRAVSIGLNRELLYGIGIRERQRRVEIRVLIFSTVE